MFSKKRLIVVVTLVIVALVVPTVASATHSDQGETEPSATLDLVGQFDVGVPGLTTDVWAHGNYAYIGSFSTPICSFDLTGVRIIDISDPANPTLAGFIKDKMGTRTNDVKVAHIETPHYSGDILVTTNEGCGVTLPRLNSDGSAAKPRGGQGGINIFDVSDPTKPFALKQNFLDKANGIHNTFIWQDGDNAYLIAVDDVDLRDVIVVDITKPYSPKEIARVGAPDWPDLGFSEVEGASVFLHDVWVQGGIAYLSYWDAGLVLLDVSDPANPVFLGDSTYPNPDLSGLPPEGNGHVAVPNADGSLVIFGDEDQTKASAFLNTTVGTFKIGVALFGPDPLTTFPSLPVHWTGGNGCTTGDFDRPAIGDEIALIQRGACFFSTKAANAQALGYSAYIVANDAARGNGLTNMSAGTADVINIPGIFVGYDAGEAMKPGASVNGLAFVEDGEGFMRVLDVTDPANMVEVGTYATERTLPPDNLAAMGTRDAHNVVVEGTTAYWAWYYEGIRVVDFSDCDAGDGFAGCSPVEVAHWGGGENPPANFWGVYLHHHPNGNTYILGSDRESGLYIFDTP